MSNFSNLFSPKLTPIYLQIVTFLTFKNTFVFLFSLQIIFSIYRKIRYKKAKKQH
ncbi:hypothetical protein HMPREF9151_01960 [Hoylesella saccharolytica F0055]|uniref:Uncharacterized protein n=1 Tax=Hoylesella saccharolytica F0055 TaxID=1127699 RepID=L1N4R9_9BACT|nr:hypothetical protein HMPREF9151_01960 [Hoylesella saccharolytica F0055]